MRSVDWIMNEISQSSSAGKPEQSGWTIGLVEDQERFREAFAGQLLDEAEVGVVHTFESAELLLRDQRLEDLDLLLVDHRLPHMSGVELIRHINRERSGLPMIVLSSISSDDVIFEAIRAGAVGYVLKSEAEGLGETVRQVMNGGAVISPTIAVRVMQSFRPGENQDDPGLTAREEQVLRELTTGASSDDVASLLGITVGTLRNHVKKIYKKLNVRNKVELMRRAYDLGYS